MMRILSLLVGILLFVPGFLWAEPLLIRLAYENTALPPFYLGEGTQVPEKLPGIAVELLQEVDRLLPEVAFEFRRAPWQRCQGELKDGLVEAIFPASFSESRKEFGSYPLLGEQPDPAYNLITLSYYLYVKSPSPVRWDGHTIEGVRTIGAPSAYSIVGDLRQLGYAVDDTAKNTRANLLKLRDGRVDAIAAQGVTTDPLLKNEAQFAGIVRLSPPLRSKANYLVFSHHFYRQQPDMIRRIWAALREVNASQMSRLADKYLEMN